MSDKKTDTKKKEPRPLPKPWLPRLKAYIVAFLLAIAFGIAKGGFENALPFQSLAEALIVTNTNGNVYKGTMNQNTFTNWKGKNVMKAKVYGIRNPNSDAQVTVRNNFATLIQAWDALTGAQKALWQQFADENITQPNPESGVRAIIRRSTSKMTAENAYVSVNSRLLQVGGTRIDVPPAHPSSIRPIPSITLAWGPVGTLTITWTKDPLSTATDVARIWAVSSTKGIVHRQLLGIAFVSAETAAFTTFKSGNGTPANFSSVVGTKMFIQADVIDQATGNMSAPTATEHTTVA